MDAETTLFEQLGLRPELRAVLTELGYEEPTPIQAQAIPPLLAGRDLMGQAATGTGKTAAFALPILNQLVPDAAGILPHALVLVPTRELAMQVADALRRYGRGLGVRVLPIYGGQPIGHQLRALSRGVDVVVATPGRALDHLGRGTLDLKAVRTVVLDEADEMLDMGFAEDLDAILAEAPKVRQTVLFSATLPRRILDIAERHLKDPVRIEIGRTVTMPGEAPKVRQAAYIVPRSHKVAALGRVLDLESPTAGIVFCRTRTVVDELSEALNTRGYRAEALHGGLSQERRDRVMRRLRGGSAELLIATDVAARGLDIDHLTHVINFDLPADTDSYVHRIGRVGRAGREGVAITLAEPREHRMLRNIERVTGQRIEIARIPTIADLRAKRLEMTQATLREVLLGEGLDRFRSVVEALSDEFDVMDVAAAAVKMAHEAGGTEPDNQEEIPDLTPRPQQERPARPEGPRPGRQGPPGGPGGGAPGEFVRVFIGLGRAAGIWPKDLVGAIVNEAGITPQEIGGIHIADRFSVVEVAAWCSDDVITALRSTSLRGKKPFVRLDKNERR